MAYVYFNPNPLGKHTGDCVIQALCKVLNQTWEETFIGLSEISLLIYETIESNATWSLYLRENGFSQHTIPNTCPLCYTVEDFCLDHPYGTYVLGTGTHAVAVVDGDIYSTWNCSSEIVITYYQKEV